MCVLQNAHKHLAVPFKATNDLDWLPRDADNEYRIKVRTAVCTAQSGHVNTSVLPVQGTTPTESSVIGRLLTARGKENHQFSDM